MVDIKKLKSREADTELEVKEGYCVRMGVTGDNQFVIGVFKHDSDTEGLFVVYSLEQARDLYLQMGHLIDALVRHKMN